MASDPTEAVVVLRRLLTAIAAAAADNQLMKSSSTFGQWRVELPSVTCSGGEIGHK